MPTEPSDQETARRLTAAFFVFWGQMVTHTANRPTIRRY